MLAKSHHADYKLIVVTGLLVVFGLVMLSSSGAVIAYQKFDDSYFFVKKQVVLGLIPGLVLAYIFSRIHYRVWKKFAGPLLVASIVLLISVFIPGIGSTHNTGSHSWLIIAGYSLQPSEIVKLTFLLYLATWFEVRGESGVKKISDGFAPFIFVLGIIMLLMILQPDIGTMMIIVFIALSMYFVAGAHIKHLLMVSFGGLLLLFTLIKLAPYRLARFTIFLNPELDPQGIGYHINQAFLAIGSGGLFGRGFGQSRQKFNYLPEITGDSIFAIIAEELGFFLTVAFVAIFVFFAYKGYKIAFTSPDIFGKLLAVGITSWIIFQSFINIGAMVGLLPITG